MRNVEVFTKGENVAVVFIIKLYFSLKVDDLHKSFNCACHL